MIGRVKSKCINVVRSMLKEGMSLHKISLCIALGIALGIFPVLGITTLLCALAALIFRLNLPAIQLVNYMVYPLQIVLLAPFYSIGSWIFKQESWLVNGQNLIALFKNDFWGSMADLWHLTLYAIFTWAAICPLLVLGLYFVFKPVISAADSLRPQKRYK